MTLWAALRKLEAAVKAADESGLVNLAPVLEAARKAVREYQDLREGQSMSGGDLWRFARGNFQFHRPGQGRTCWRRKEHDGWEIHITDPSEKRAELAPGEQWKVRWVRPDRTDLIFLSEMVDSVEAAIKWADQHSAPKEETIMGERE